VSHQIEREVKFLLERKHLNLSQALGKKQIRQVYLPSQAATLRVRAYQDGRHELTLKFRRDEEEASEYTLDLDPKVGPQLYQEAVHRGLPEICKTRFFFPARGEGMEGLRFEVDLFEDRFEFLTLCELEYPEPERPAGLAERPSWYPAGPWGVDVTTHGGFRNSRLVSCDEHQIEILRGEFRRLLQGLGV
jgi:CYTH domain-containing protein